MSLEEEIKQRSFKTEQSKLIVNLIYTSNRLKERISARLKANGITMQQYNVLRIVRGSGESGSTTSEIRERLLDKMSDASRMVDRLVSMGFLEKVRDKQDRRIVFIFLTHQGKTLVNLLIRREEVESLAAGMDKKKAQQLNELLDCFRSDLKS
ncbi:MAG: MarR family transcriptional regulator [Flavobacteriales bacterium]|jgi:DNA-binding MarR family transcriptional regulator|nr:MarR family transcriptional regulator [Flavobacteriales bacterium]|tara:strand:+ start:277 stop:735 length:459 start_codon:yes stop_codon:yes gene_type:complete